MARRKSITQPAVQAMQIRRLCYFAGCLVAGFGLLGYRLYDLQVVRHAELRELARNNTERVFVREPRRGNIQDVRGNLLATSKPVHSVCADPHFLGTNYMTVARAVAPLLDMPLDEVADKLRPRMREMENGEMVPLKYVVLKRKVEEEDWERIQEAMKQLTFGVDESKLRPTQRAAYSRLRSRGVFSEADQTRFYPNQSLAAHVLGYVGMDTRDTPTGPVLYTSGKDGIEYTLDSVLTGVQGWRETETDSRRRELVLYRRQDVAPKSGLNVVLSLDAGVQHIVEEELAVAAEKHTPLSVSCIVVRPRTGEIVAMASLPTFNPNNLLGSTPEQRRNRIITDRSEPGSTFKIVVVSAALSEGLVRLDDMYDCENGRFYFAGLPLRDDHPFGVISVERIISKSSNIGAAKIGIKLGPGRLSNYVEDFGFGVKTGIPLPGEVGGLVNPTNRWSKISITRIPMGHEIDCTPLQMVMAMSAIANGGLLMKPMLVDRFTDDEGKVVARFQPQPVRQVISPEAAAKMVHALKEVVSTNGTAIRAKLGYYTVAGKTGTAQKIINGQYSRAKHFSSFIGFFPADNPELCISVVMDEPKKGYYGGESAAPVFQRIAERAANYLAIPPEFTPEQSLVTNRHRPQG